MTAEEKWDKLRAHFVAIRRHMDHIAALPSITGVPDVHDQGYNHALNDVLGLIHRLDQEDK
jgi:hypothetical protein